jgi:replicative DNA helicase
MYGCDSGIGSSPSLRQAQDLHQRREESLGERALGAESRSLELGSIARNLLLVAKDLEVPILSIHQLNRSVENRSDKRPLLADLRGSGQLEEHADVALMLYRDGYYYPVLLSGQRAGEHYGDLGAQEPPRWPVGHGV